MARILAISSSVLSEAVGLGATRFALERLGHEVWALPTITLSNHPGRAHPARQTHSPDDLFAHLDAMEANGLLAQVDAVLTGYLPTPAHVGFAAEVIERVKTHNAQLITLCDPILGDEGKGLYINEDAACAVRDRLLPLADIVTPNAFELAWLTGRALRGLEDAKSAMASLQPKLVLTTSFPRSQETISNLLKSGESYFDVSVDRLENVPHGTGDFFAALFLGALLNERTSPKALGFAAEATRIAIESLADRDRFEIVSSQEAWVRAEPLIAAEF